MLKPQMLEAVFVAGCILAGITGPLWPRLHSDVLRIRVNSIPQGCLGVRFSAAMRGPRMYF